MGNPKNWQWPPKEAFLDDPIVYLSDAHEELADEIYAPAWRLQGTTAVGAGLATIGVLVDIDRMPAYIFVEPSWLTTHRVTAKATTGFTVDFGTVAPGGGGTIDWWVLVAEAGP